MKTTDRKALIADSRETLGKVFQCDGGTVDGTLGTYTYMYKFSPKFYVHFFRAIGDFRIFMLSHKDYPQPFCKLLWMVSQPQQHPKETIELRFHCDIFHLDDVIGWSSYIWEHIVSSVCKRLAATLFLGKMASLESKGHVHVQAVLTNLVTPHEATNQVSKILIPQVMSSVRASGTLPTGWSWEETSTSAYLKTEDCRINMNRATGKMLCWLDGKHLATKVGRTNTNPAEMIRFYADTVLDQFIYVKMNWTRPADKGKPEWW